QKIAGEAVLCMQEQYGSDPAHILAAMGPSIKQCHFEVDEDVYLAFREAFPELIDECSLKKGQKYHIDTDALNVDTLKRAGLTGEHISRCRDCTYCKSETYFSHRREGSTGRMCAVIELI
ncbi:MAG: laccase domain-containing protein, partial [Clostridia bacterium]|nr:laccase domain-containing protein [Clostridia bacterium]